MGYTLQQLLWLSIMSKLNSYTFIAAFKLYYLILLLYMLYYKVHINIIRVLYKFYRLY